jgi:hypothetical protein
MTLLNPAILLKTAAEMTQTATLFNRKDVTESHRPRVDGYAMLAEGCKAENLLINPFQPGLGSYMDVDFVNARVSQCF